MQTCTSVDFNWSKEVVQEARLRTTLQSSLDMFSLDH